MLGKSNQYQKQITSIADNKTGFPRLSEEYDTVPFNGLISNGKQRAAAKINFESIIFECSIVIFSTAKIIFVSAC